MLAVVVFMSEKYTSISAFMPECLRTPRARIIWSLWLVWYQRLWKGLLFV